jgi:hypothetical protein
MVKEVHINGGNTLEITFVKKKKDCSRCALSAVHLIVGKRGLGNSGAKPLRGRYSL